MKSLRNIGDDNLGDEAPRLKDLIIVVVVVAVLTLLSLFAYHKLGWFH
jgi:hypothetical protein